ncbi:hypothetical protein H072_5203 [Dactylellina haptotyla CBS 200.50]|uniref:CBM1 domain-containing protein n=1 Tax=Dactylellina haptotyla (strain CBS 200.50) TaxID=1284197 RepID=S8ADC0_DACHA|nr:hypothetical protein H072_5203 [Dactylellina haptotyla CBS 200.50]
MKVFSIVFMSIIGASLAAPAPAPVAVAEPAAATGGGYQYCYQCSPTEPKICLPYIPIINPCSTRPTAVA